MQQSSPSLELQAVTATVLSGASGCLALMLYKPMHARGIRALSAVHVFSQGTRAAIVSCAASCTVVPLWTHLITGPIASITSSWIDRILQHYGLHDKGSMVSVHLSGGAIGLVAVGFFAEEVSNLSKQTSVRLLLEPKFEFLFLFTSAQPGFRELGARFVSFPPGLPLRLFM